jgi:ABC-type antimicrobial peptide transport system permease subunit
VPVKVEDTVDFFPTMTSRNERFLIADLTSVIRYANLGAIVRELLPNEVWISTGADAAQSRQVVEAVENVEGFTNTFIHDRAALLAESNVDPLVQAGWRALLFVAFSTVLILSCLGFLFHAYVSFQNRRLQFALLRTVGLSPRQLTAMVWLEQTLVVVVGLALGTWMGGRLGAAIMPFMGHDDWGYRVFPPYALEVEWTTLLMTYAAMTFVFAVISLGVIWLVRRIALHRMLRLGEM